MDTRSGAVKVSEGDPPPVIIVWKRAIQFTAITLAGVYGLIMIPHAKLYSLLWGLFLYMVSILGTTAGAHRLWSHRSYKARLPLRIILAIMQTVSLQNSIFEWVRDHRLHHKFTDTNADPTNASRGFFFAHMGWLMVRKHPDVTKKGRQIDLSDLFQDPIVMFQKRNYKYLVTLFWLIIPTAVPLYFWSETLHMTLSICVFLRFSLAVHCTSLANSVSHMWGMRPYDRTMKPTDNTVVTFLTLGEGFHNFHHTFPQDYSTSEFPWSLNLCTIFIDACAQLGLVYDRRKVSAEVINRRRERTGDLSGQVKDANFESCNGYQLERGF